MIGMRRSRLAALVMLVVLTTISVLADRCLVICHVTEPASQAASSEPSCHHAATDGAGDAVIQGTSGCAHDHEAAAFGDSQESRASHDRLVSAALVPARVVEFGGWFSEKRLPPHRLVPRPVSQGASLVPLRI